MSVWEGVKHAVSDLFFELCLLSEALSSSEHLNELFCVSTGNQLLASSFYKSERNILSTSMIDSKMLIHESIFVQQNH